MLRTAMIVVMILGAFGFVGVFALGVFKAHSPKNSYLRERARWPSSRYGGYSEQAAARYAEESARPGRMATICVAIAAIAGLLAAWAISRLGGSFAVQLVGLMAVTYVSVWAGFLIARRVIHQQ